MALPNPAMSFSPFAILTAEEMNNLVENNQALADGSGLNTGAITTIKIGAAAVTAAKIDWTTILWNSTETVVGHTGTKPVYRKYLTGFLNVIAGTIQVPHGITTLDQMLSVNAALALSGSTSFQVMPHVEAAQRIALGYDQTSINFSSSFAWGNTRPYRIVIHYTKV